MITVPDSVVAAGVAAAERLWRGGITHPAMRAAIIAGLEKWIASGGMDDLDKLEQAAMRAKGVVDRALFLSLIARVRAAEARAEKAEAALVAGKAKTASTSIPVYGSEESHAMYYGSSLEEKP